jgi:2-polyprenyl-3-methyl-5-hydroxy-6-metoxy-1,4-benzoquinol methylase
MINLFKDGNGEYVKKLDFGNTWSIAHTFRFASFAHVVMKNGYQSVLDVGFGDNMMSQFLEKAGYTGKYLGIDVNEKFVDDATSHASELHFDAVYEQLTINQLGDKFDCIILGEVIEHIDPKSDALKFMQKIKSLLAENGRVLLSTPNKIEGVKVWPNDHIDEFSIDELEVLCAAAGFCVIRKIGYWNNTANTKDMLNEIEFAEYAYYNEVVPNSLLNVMFNIVHPEKSKQIILVLTHDIEGL